MIVSWENILQIHEKGRKVVMAITGGGAEAIGHLLKYGQGSNTLLEAIVPYDQKSFDEFVRGTPDKYCSPGAARDLAMASFQRAIELQDIVNAQNLIGIGVTCSLAKDNERKGREHHAYIAVQTFDKTSTYSMNLSVPRTREQEEDFVAKAIISTLNETILGIENALKSREKDMFVQTDYYPDSYKVFDLISGKNKTIAKKPETDFSNKIIFAGTFNPLHEGHKNIANKIKELTGQPVNLEICIHNVDKPALNYQDLYMRKLDLDQKIENIPSIENVFLTALPTFADKAKFFNNATFIVGWDTIVRIGNPKYGNLNEVMNTFKQQNTKFIVFHRIINGKPSWENPDQIYEPLIAISKIIPPEEMPLLDISSSQIRKRVCATS